MRAQLEFPFSAIEDFDVSGTAQHFGRAARMPNEPARASQGDPAARKTFGIPIVDREAMDFRVIYPPAMPPDSGVGRTVLSGYYHSARLSGGGTEHDRHTSACLSFLFVDARYFEITTTAFNRPLQLTHVTLSGVRR